MSKQLLTVLICLSWVTGAQALDYQKLSESVDKQKATESVDQDKIGEAVSTEGVGACAATNDCLQYIQDKHEVTSNDRFGVHIGPSSDFSDIQAGMSQIRTKSDHPQVALDVLNARNFGRPRLASCTYSSG